MKVAYVLPKYDESAGEHFFHIYRLLSELGKSVRLSVLIEKCKGEPRFPGVKEVQIIRSSFAPLRMIETFYKLLRMRLSGTKVFYVHYSFFGAITASMITRVIGGKVFYWNCGLPHLFFKSFGRRGWITSKINDDWSLRVSLKMVHFLITGSKRMKEYYHAEFNVPKDKILVLPNEIDLERFTPKRPNNKIPKVFFVHRMSERKGAHYLVPIAEKVLQKTPAEFIIAGDGPYLPKLQAQIKNKKLGNSMKTFGSVPNKEVMKYYAKSDVFLMPSDEEGFPRVLLEAMAMGTPFVASDVGGVRDMVAKEAQEFVVKKGDVDAFAQKIVRILSDKSLQDRLSKAGLKQVKRYDLKRVVPQLVKLLKENS